MNLGGLQRHSLLCLTPPFPLAPGNVKRRSMLTSPHSPTRGVHSNGLPAERQPFSVLYHIEQRPRWIGCKAPRRCSLKTRNAHLQPFDRNRHHGYLTSACKPETGMSTPGPVPRVHHDHGKFGSYHFPTGLSYKNPTSCCAGSTMHDSNGPCISEAHQRIRKMTTGVAIS
jgi:hypothetical protein